MADYVDNEQYWIERHAKLRGSLCSVGNVGASEDENAAAYDRKHMLMQGVLANLGRPSLRGAAALDAGCGIGLMSELFINLGAALTGVDASPEALEQARKRCPSGHFVCQSIVDCDVQAAALGGFDFVFCIDVLYHVVSDENWRTAVENLARHVAPGGHLILAEQLKPEPIHHAAHVRYRTRAMYDDVLAGRATFVSTTGQSWATVYKFPG